LDSAWRIEDAQLSIRLINQPELGGDEQHRSTVELTSSRIFLEPQVVAAALKPGDDAPGGVDPMTGAPMVLYHFVTNGVGVLTYFATLILAGNRATPYSMVTAAGRGFTLPGMRDDEILVNEWLAADLEVKPGDDLELSYYLVDSGSRL